MASHAAPWRLFDWGDRLQSGGGESLNSVRSALLRCFDAEDVLMLFRYTENSSFPYIPNVVALNRVIYAALKPYT